MVEFVIKSDEKISETKYSIWICFSNEPLQKNTLYSCVGTALIVPDDENRCWLDFNFYHSADWREIIDMYITAPAYIFSRAELLKFGNMIACLINQYIAKHN